MVKPKSLYVLVHTCGHVQDMFHDGRTFYWYSKAAAEKAAEIHNKADSNPLHSVRVIKMVPGV